MLSPWIDIRFISLGVFHQAKRIDPNFAAGQTWRGGTSQILFGTMLDALCALSSDAEERAGLQCYHSESNELELEGSTDGTATK